MLLCNAVSEFEGRLGYSFVNPGLLELALTHSSYANETGICEHNERQEFLGDAVLELCVSSELFRRYPEGREGDLTRMRSRLVSEGALAEIARGVGLNTFLKLGRGEERQGGRKRDAILGDALEAVLAAVYEDGGFEAALAVVSQLFAARWQDCAESAGQTKDHKTHLQEIVQRLFRERPIYTRVANSGPEHAQNFVVTLRLPDGREFSAGGSSNKKAEQEAARLAITALEDM